MSRRKVWVKRPGSAATILLIKEDDLVDDAKDIILRKYANSLGRHYDAPDLTIRIVSRGQPGERILSPDEPFCGTIDSYYPGGQGMDEALLIDIPVKRTPRPSPGRGQPNAYQNYYQQEEVRPHESGTEYFPPMPPPPTAAAAAAMPSPLPTANSHDGRQSHAAHERAMSVLATGQVPALPSPGGARRMHTSKQHRPLNARHNTSSPTTIANNIASRSNRPRLDSTASNDKHAVIPIVPQPLPTPDNPEATVAPSKTALSNPPTPRIASPRPRQGRKTRQKQVPDGPSLPPGLTLLDTSMPPINVLIVEDNMINMKLLEQFVRRLGVRWHTAVNGREAVQRWRKGGFHLVLMDIQLPIMSGLEATKEIRRLERVNNIGVFSSSSASEAAPDLDVAPNEAEAISKVEDEDKLGDVGRLFKSPVIIVALTASNLQSDRHEALAAGCNDFLTKPVNFVWFERKVKEWGCMQALIDFDGWRKWEDFATENGLKDPRDIKTGPKASASKRAAPRDVKPPSSNLPVMNVKNSTTTNLPVPPKSAVAAETTSTQDFANTGTTLPPPKKKSFGDGVAEEEGRLVKEGSEDTVVGVAAGGA
ncbi:hypothetical protein EJ08DRAFT_588286 [Tothia fuscella]|uniref:Response regulatory domain-containing protein n=1 Tax=Tothia fuscella TaxID=1048955 RepID=A0A9P4TY13_9PEZI|nr:hypothetical protein EJ08DRAFT_588286 [Tothia fuscella]